jgi:beta-1,4-mannosyl-glycoprotein beta-1,4-N-acetylglucosaminyltransferase
MLNTATAAPGAFAELIFDCFTFLNELDLLEIRLRLLDDVVDYFVLVEAARTFSNQPKPLHYAANRERFARWNDRIIHVEATLDGSGLDFSRPASWDPRRGPWQLEWTQRDSMSEIRTLLTTDDTVLISDADEIPDPAAVVRAAGGLSVAENPMAGYVLVQLMHHYYLNMQSMGLDRLHNGTLAVSATHFRERPPSHIRRSRRTFQRIRRGGWHFSFLGPPAEIAYKVSAYSHQEFNRQAVTNEQRIDRTVRSGRGVTDSFGHYYEWRELDSYPTQLAAIMRDYPHLILGEPTLPSRLDPGRALMRFIASNDGAMERVGSAWKKVGKSERWLRDRLR